MKKIKWHKYPKEKPTTKHSREMFYVTIEHPDEYGERTERDVMLSFWFADGFATCNNLITAWARVPIPKPYKKK